MNDYLAESYATVQIAERHRAAAVDRLAAQVRRAQRPHLWADLRTRFAAWTERPQAGRSLGVCCPA